eukprot:CAMPEP_0194408564 /NCGR_PEP_ID=MMETSP0176-20130528/6387_1 /TAXON_ID=216777 /ORGANISM="Proboscia alata, Strain PI-D3" /LENGTH=613 /DNA_ID=CAMNT_0039208683 /DNA_START=93 /DNA_END=1934 /DNA_ORIENTATION=+
MARHRGSKNPGNGGSTVPPNTSKGKKQKRGITKQSSASKVVGHTPNVPSKSTHISSGSSTASSSSDSSTSTPTPSQPTPSPVELQKIHVREQLRKKRLREVSERNRTSVNVDLPELISWTKTILLCVLLSMGITTTTVLVANAIHRNKAIRHARRRAAAADQQCCESESQQAPDGNMFVLAQDEDEYEDVNFPHVSENNVRQPYAGQQQGHYQPEPYQPDGLVDDYHHTHNIMHPSVLHHSLDYSSPPQHRSYVIHPRPKLCSDGVTWGYDDWSSLRSAVHGLNDIYHYNLYMAIHHPHGHQGGNNQGGQHAFSEMQQQQEAHHSHTGLHQQPHRVGKWTSPVENLAHDNHNHGVYYYDNDSQGGTVNAVQPPHEDSFFREYPDDQEIPESFVICPGALLTDDQSVNPGGTSDGEYSGQAIFINAEDVIIECDGCVVDLSPHLTTNSGSTSSTKSLHRQRRGTTWGYNYDTSSSGSSGLNDGTHFAFGPHAKGAMVRGLTLMGATTSSLTFHHHGAEATFEDCTWINNAGGLGGNAGAVADLNSTSSVSFFRCDISDLKQAPQAVSRRPSQKSHSSQQHSYPNTAYIGNSMVGSSTVGPGGDDKFVGILTIRG